MPQLCGLGRVGDLRTDDLSHPRADFDPVPLRIAEANGVGAARLVPFRGAGQNRCPGALQDTGGFVHVRAVGDGEGHMVQAEPAVISGSAGSAYPDG
jgi:hypothetical protein